MSSQESGWKADPSGRFELRYHDGTKWTEHVSTGGVQSTDAYADPSAGAPGMMPPPQQQWQQPGAPAAAGSQFDMNAVTADLKKQPPYFFLVAGGGIGLFLFAFFSWATVTYASIYSGTSENSSAGTSGGLDAGKGTVLIGLLLIAYSVVRLMKMEGKLPPAIAKNMVNIALGLAALALLITIYNVIDIGSTDSAFGLEVSIGLGLWLSLLSAIAATAGAVLEFKTKPKTAA